jgi:hypothetical protein
LKGVIEVLAENKIRKAEVNLRMALENLRVGNARISVGYLDRVRDEVIAATHLIINEIKDTEGKF